MDKCKSFLIIGVVIVILLSGFSVNAFSENWYLINEYNMTIEDNKTFRMRVVARSHNEDDCYELAGSRKDKLAGGDLISTLCVSGEAYDTVLEGVFNNVPSEEPYITLKDGYGNRTVIDFLSVSKEVMGTLAEKIALKCEKEGFTDIRVIDEQGKRRTNYLILGSGENDVRRIKGEPDDIVGRVWFYGKDMIIFDKDGKIMDYSDFTETLDIRK